MSKRGWAVGFVSSVVAVAMACGGSDDETKPTDTEDERPETTGRSCRLPTDCYSELDASALKGEVQCLDRVTNGYCTHACTTDADCCAIPGECPNGLRHVCAPFESTGQMMCFLSCEGSDLETARTAGLPVDGGDFDDTAYCHAFASTEFGCRSTGGGSKNRKVCVP